MFNNELSYFDTPNIHHVLTTFIHQTILDHHFTGQYLKPKLPSVVSNFYFSGDKRIEIIENQVTFLHSTFANAINT